MQGPLATGVNSVVTVIAKTVVTAVTAGRRIAACTHVIAGRRVTAVRRVAAIASITAVFAGAAAK